GRKAADFDLEERPCDQGVFGAPSVDPAVFVFALVGFQIVTMGKRDATRKTDGWSTRPSHLSRSARSEGRAWALIGRASAAYSALPRAISSSAMSATYSIDAALPWLLRKLGNASQLGDRLAAHDRSVTMNRRTIASNDSSPATRRVMGKCAIRPSSGLR